MRRPWMGAKIEWRREQFLFYRESAGSITIMPCFRHFLYTNFWTMVYFHVAFSEPGREVALQHCTICGSEIPDNAHFCGKCGHVFSSVSTIDKETSIGVENEQQSEDVATTSTQGLVHSEESKNGKQTDDVAALSTQGLAHSAEREQAEGKAPEGLEAEETEAEASVPSGFSEDDRVQYPVSPDPKARRGSAARWIIIAVVGLLVLAGIAGGLLFLLRSQGSVTTVTPAIGTNPGTSNNSGVTPVDTTCSTGACITRIAGTTPVAGTKAIFLINFSGAVKGMRKLRQLFMVIRNLAPWILRSTGRRTRSMFLDTGFARNKRLVRKAGRVASR